MKRVIIGGLCLGLVFGACQKADKTKQIAITIGDIKISVAEFEEAFRRSFYGREDTPAARQEFLKAYIMRLLILQEAERKGLDRDPQFLKDVEAFWQQSLVKLILDKKMSQISDKVVIGPRQIKEYYQKHKADDFAEKSLEEASAQIKLVLLRQEQEKLLKQWIEQLKKKTKIKVREKLLEME
jgi:hypothetical protein